VMDAMTLPIVPPLSCLESMDGSGPPTHHEVR